MKFGINIDNFLINLNGFLLEYAPSYMKEKYNLSVVDSEASNIIEMFDIENGLKANFPLMDDIKIENKLAEIVDDFWLKFYLKYLTFISIYAKTDFKMAINELYANDNEIYLIYETKIMKNDISKKFEKLMFKKILSLIGLNYHKLLTFDSKDDMITGINRRSIEVLAENRTSVISNTLSFLDLITENKNSNFMSVDNVFCIDNGVTLSETVNRVIKHNNTSLLPKDHILTNSPSSDKAWLKYYKVKDTKYTVDRKHPYERMYNMHIDYTDGPVFTYSKTNKELKATEFFENIAAYAKWLKEKGIKKGDMVPVISLNIFDATEMIIALMTIGAVIVEISPTNSKELIIEKLSIIDPKPKIMYIGDYFNSKGGQHLAPMIEEISDKFAIENVIYSKLDLEIVINELKNKIKDKIKDRGNKSNTKTAEKESSSYSDMFNAMFNYKYRDNFISINELKKLRKKSVVVDYSDLNVDLDDTAAIVFTSGKSPKGVELTYRNIDAELVQYQNSILNLKRNDKISCFLPFDHVFGLIIGIMVTISTGMTGVLDPAFDRKKIGNLIYDDEVDYLTTIPGLLSDLLNDDRTLKKRENNLRKVFCGSQVLPENTFLNMKKNFPNNKIVDGYGSSEGCCVTLIDGIPILNGDVKVVNTDTLNECDYYEIGEMCISHEVVFKRYHNMPELTNSVKKIHSDGKLWYHTGDLAYFNEDGRVIYRGRVTNDFIKSNGHQVYLYKIKSLIEGHKDVKECLVIGREDLKKGHVPVVFVKPTTDEVNVDELHNQIVELCSSTLEYYELPNNVFVVDKFPLGNRGKIDISFINENYSEILNDNLGGTMKIMNYKKRV